MKCTLCEKSIDNYNPGLHNFIIDEKHTANICSECVDKFLKWQGKKYSILFPTKAMKKRFKQE
ncbi:MAG: hypothetical protein WCJ46_07850 [bacterium]